MEFKDKLILEYTDLTVKIDRLKTYISNNDDTDLERDKQYILLMKEQLEAMYNYQMVLIKRIKFFMD